MIEINASALQQAEKLLQGIPGAAKKASLTAVKKTVRGAKRDAGHKFIVQHGHLVGVI